jgi:L-lactate dehydrogenase (cytochrome)
MGIISWAEVQAAGRAGKCWLLLGDTVYDLAEFKAEHPGGPEYIERWAGDDGTEEFLESHPLDIIERTITGDALKRAVVGKIDKATLPADHGAAQKKKREANGGGHGAAAAAEPLVGKPPLDAIINIYDFEAVARQEMLGAGKKEGWDYYSSGADDEMSMRENHSAFHRLWLRPRVLVNVRDVDTTTTILGHTSSMPVMLSAVAMCGLGHKDGEVAWCKAAGAHGVIFMAPSLASRGFDDINAARREKQPLFFQLYVNPDRAVARKMVEKAEAAGCTALFITVDAPQLGNREKARHSTAQHSTA